MDINNSVEKALSGRWIAGRNTSDAMKLTKRFNKKGVKTVLNYMGMDLWTKASLDDAMSSILEVIKEIKRQHADAEIAVKSTQLGLHIDEKLMYKNYSTIVKAAKKNNVFVWLDQVEENRVTPTIDLYVSMVKSGNTGICIQAYLRRSKKDIERLIKLGATIRIVKGAYKAPKSIAFTNMDEVTKNYLDLMKYMFKYNKKRFVIASHDPIVIEQCEALNKKRKGTKAEVVSAMLNGIRNSYAVYMAKQGNKVEIYIPYGKRWVEFGVKRLTSLHNLELVTRSFLEDQRI